jgi:alkanesulfonate monooxygenase SsuD/methylene tetrahydromethanopterin reductase-like flavin-dependent oxidoreductase (luciferase family)
LARDIKPQEMLEIGLIDHLEGPRALDSRQIYDEVAELTCLADELGVRHAWFAEHHAHAHHGHMPAPLLFALHLATRTRQIRLGTADICLNLHHALEVAEQLAVADALSGGRMCFGFGSSGTPAECAMFGVPDLPDERERHERFARAIEMMRAAWDGQSPTPRILPAASPDLPRNCWIAVNSLGAARGAGACNFSVMFSHLRTPEQYRQYVSSYRAAGGTGRVAANRPIFVGPNDDAAFAAAEPALRILWRRFRDEGKIPRDAQEPASAAQLCAHTINFIVGGAARVAAELRALRAQAPFDLLNIEIRWAGLSHEAVADSLRRFMADVVPRI